MEEWMRLITENAVAFDASKLTSPIAGLGTETLSSWLRQDWSFRPDEDYRPKVLGLGLLLCYKEREEKRRETDTTVFLCP
jgi:hypothetical protein